MAKIIVADDSKLMRGLLKGALEGMGHEVEEWPEVSAVEVAERLSASTAELIITDYQMPGCNGLTLSKLALKARPGLPIIVLTASRDPSILEPLRKVGVPMILHKPIQIKILGEIVAQCLGPA